MSGIADPSPAQTPLEHEPTEGSERSSTSRGKGLSVLGLLFASVLNLASLAFIAYHFANHPDEPALAQTAANGLQRSETVPARTAEPPMGNIDLAPASYRILGIASHVTADAVGLPKAIADAPAPPNRNNSALPAATAAGTTPGHWVQLGALSKEATARQYWSRLKAQHKALLDGRKPSIFGPDQVGGSLYHVRLGPMANIAAAGLCSKLEEEGVDCFCLPIEGESVPSSDASSG